ncbi:pectinesterase family protein [Symbioplanes lichenis]|uniref:pectinesterase family protein n=1 Tax=Symbioplanes lichenis TaxID=1629072 RepID=UPI00273834C5|nr:pectinesterase family protein [Actinoplanes lichenis]
MRLIRWTAPAAAALALSVAAPVAAAPVPAAVGAGSAVESVPGPPPGTVTRPVLSAAEAAPYVAENYLRWSGTYAAPVENPWRPGPIRTGRPDFVVGAGTGGVGAGSGGTGAGIGFRTIQEAVNRAYQQGGTARRTIAVLPGTYTGTVFIPAGSPPLTVYGAGAPGQVRLEFSVDATISPAAWAALVNAGGRYAEGDPAWTMFQSCATRTSATAGLCATVLWSQAPDLQLKNLTVVNTLLDTVDRGTHQALAVRTDADRTLLEGVRLIGRQDTFYANAEDATRIARVVVRDSYLEGDTDFVFGRASAVFDRNRFHLVSTRKDSGGIIFAPSTLPQWRFGFLVTRSLITADAGYQAAPTGFLGRAWDQGAGTTGYVPGTSPNGQLVLRDSRIGPGFVADAPWAPAATTGRPFAAPIEPGRDLDDPTHNRLWEYATRPAGKVHP